MIYLCLNVPFQTDLTSSKDNFNDILPIKAKIVFCQCTCCPISMLHHVENELENANALRVALGAPVNKIDAN